MEVAEARIQFDHVRKNGGHSTAASSTVTDTGWRQQQPINRNNKKWNNKNRLVKCFRNSYEYCYTKYLLPAYITHITLDAAAAETIFDNKRR